MAMTVEIEEALERLYIHETESGAYPEDLAGCPWGQEARSAGLIELKASKCYLTAKGRQTGRDMVRRHRLAERLLGDVLAAGSEHLDEDACRFEHLLQHGLDEKICILLGHPATCPHGKAIPAGECCRKARADGIKEVGRLSDAKAGASGIVAYLATRDSREVQKMMAMGILPGTDIELIRRFPSFVFQVGYSQFTVDKPLAEAVFVHWNDNQNNLKNPDGP